MAKRRLTDKQKKLIKHRQAGKQAAGSAAISPPPPTDATDQPKTTLQGRALCHNGSHIIISAEQGNFISCRKRATASQVVAGDYVTYELISPDEGVIINHLPRKTELKRVDNYNKLKLVAANVDTACIVFAPKPTLSWWLLDCYLVAAISADISPILVLNKSDLLNSSDVSPANKETCLSCIEYYSSKGFPCVMSSSKEAEGTSKLRAMLADKSAVFTGQSGVGKSSLVNTLLGENRAQIGNLSESKQLGMHTTITAHLYQIPSGGELIDSPGIREFNLPNISSTDLERGFPDVTNVASRCKFRNCNHSAEKGCAVPEAISSRELLKTRFDHYQKLKTMQ